MRQNSNAIAKQLMELIESKKIDKHLFMKLVYAILKKNLINVLQNEIGDLVKLISVITRIPLVKQSIVLGEIGHRLQGLVNIQRADKVRKGELVEGVIRDRVNTEYIVYLKYLNIKCKYSLEESSNLIAGSTYWFLVKYVDVEFDEFGIGVNFIDIVLERESVTFIRKVCALFIPELKFRSFFISKAIKQVDHVILIFVSSTFSEDRIYKVCVGVSGNRLREIQRALAEKVVFLKDFYSVGIYLSQFMQFSRIEAKNYAISVLKSYAHIVYYTILLSDNINLYRLKGKNNSNILLLNKFLSDSIFIKIKVFKPSSYSLIMLT